MNSSLVLVSKADTFFKNWTWKQAEADKRGFTVKLAEVLALGPTLSQLGRWLFDSLPFLELSIGIYIKKLISSMPHSGLSACARDKDILPIPIRAAEVFLRSQDLPDGELAWTLLMALGLSYLWSHGCTPEVYRPGPPYGGPGGVSFEPQW